MIRELQAEITEWHIRNFGKVSGWKPLLVVTEEVGELAHAYIKREQKIRMTEDHDENIKDAVADIFIGLASFCSTEGIDFQSEIEKVWSKVKQRDWTKNPNNAHQINLSEREEKK